ncbi:MAG: GNAT family N-acetyltransferase [Candidatus Aenigmarchaeota archaeon]|nr:GNAT family N-acetyltransferase [Candidatus Aenigmarchaeota archaeon]
MNGEVQQKDGQFFIEAAGRKAVLDYVIDGDRMDIFHTFTAEELRGLNLAEKLTQAAFEFAKKNNLKVVPTCPYVKDTFLKKHKEFDKMIEH